MAIRYKEAVDLVKTTNISGVECIPISGTEYTTPEQIYEQMSASRGGGGQICIHTERTGKGAATALKTVIEGVADEDLARMADSTKYRLCLMRFRKGHAVGRSWHITALPYFKAERTGEPIHIKAHRMPKEHTWWPITGRKVSWFGGASIFDVLPYDINTRHHRFKNSKNIKMYDGVALFKYTERGGEGWARISNIAYVESFLCCRDTQGKTPYINISVKM